MSEQPPPRRTFLNVAIALLAVIAVSVTYWMTLPPADQPAAGEVPSPPPDSLPLVAGVGGDFSLPSTAGTNLTLADLRGKVVMLNFGFTHCPDVCPMELSRMASALRELEAQGADMTRVQSVFVTFDPERDTLDHLREYVAYFHPSLIGLRGDAAQTAELARRYKVVYLKQDTGSASGYVFQHSDFIYVIDTRGRVRLLIGGKDPDAAIVEAVKRLLRDSAKDHSDKFATEKSS